MNILHHNIPHYVIAWPRNVILVISGKSSHPFSENHFYSKAEMFQIFLHNRYTYSSTVLIHIWVLIPVHSVYWMCSELLWALLVTL